MSLFYTPWNSIPGKPDFKTINGQSIFGSGDIGIDLSGQVPYTGATQDLNLGIRNLKALSVYIGGSSGPKLTNNAGTIELKTNDDSAFAPLKADRLTVANPSGLGPSPYFSAVNSLSAATMELRNSSDAGYTSLNLNSLTATGTLTVPQIQTASGALTLSPANNFVYLPTGKSLHAAQGTGFNYHVGKVGAINGFEIGGTLDNAVHLIRDNSGVVAFRNALNTADSPFSASTGTFSGDLLLSTLNGSKLGFGTGVNTNITTQASGFLLYNAPYGGGSATHYFRENGTAYLQIAGASLEVQGTRCYTFSVGGASGGDIALYRIDANTLEVNKRTAGTQRDLRARGLNPMAAIFTSAGAVGADGLSLYRTANWGIGFDNNSWPGVGINGVHKLRLGTSVVMASDGFLGSTNVTNTGTNYDATVTLSRYDDSTWQMGTGGTQNANGNLRMNNIRAAQPTFFPGNSVTPDVTNGALTIEATSNTQLTFKLRGSDGTVRTGTLTLS